MGLAGKPRQLHIDEAIRAVGNTSKSIQQQKPKILWKTPFKAERLISCDKFVIDQWQVAKTACRQKKHGFEILHVVAGSGHYAILNGR
ncbi:hypothetical protein ES703_125804 [subsurface metagenome]